MADNKGCKNHYGLTYISDTEESNEESTFEEELLWGNHTKEDSFLSINDGDTLL